MTASTKPQIVQTGPLMAYAADQLKARFTVHELWKAPDRAALLREVAVAIDDGEQHVLVIGQGFDIGGLVAGLEQ